MKSYVFCIGILLMLFFSLTGCTWVAARTLRRIPGSYPSIAVGFVTLVVLIVALSWSVPPRG